MQAPNHEPQADLGYEPSPRPAMISHRAFRLLLGLTLLNTFMLAASIGPGARGWAASAYASFQGWRVDRQKQAAQRAARALLLPAQQQCMNYTASPGTLVYAEDAAGIA